MQRIAGQGDARDTRDFLLNRAARPRATAHLDGEVQVEEILVREGEVEIVHVEPATNLADERKVDVVVQLPRVLVVLVVEVA